MAEDLYSEYEKEVSSQINSAQSSAIFSGGLSAINQVDTIAIKANVSQTFYYEQQLRLIDDQRKYAGAIKWATIVVAAATVAQVWIAIAAYVRSGEQNTRSIQGTQGTGTPSPQSAPTLQFAPSGHDKSNSPLNVK